MHSYSSEAEKAFHTNAAGLFKIIAVTKYPKIPMTNKETNKKKSLPK